MRTICFYFQVHQPFRLKRYRFFDIGNDHYYYDDYNNEEIITRVAHRCYLPANKVILDLINATGGKFKVAYSISGVALEQLEMYAPEVIDSFKELAKTGAVEFLAETYAHSLASLRDEEEFTRQVKEHSKKIESLFGQKPTVFRNTELIYSDELGEMVANMGFKAMLTEGAKHVLGWKSPNYVYCNAYNPNLKLLLKNFKLSDDISFRFSNRSWSEWPLTVDKFIGWINDMPESEEIVNLFMGYEAFGEMQPAESGIFEFLKAFPRIAFENKIKFATPSEIIKVHKPVAPINVPYPISWADEERDLSAWLGNDLQNEAFDKLMAIGERVRLTKDRRLLQDWNYLQASDHFYYMSTKHFSGGAVHSYFSPYERPFDAFTNYMNVLSDFIERVHEQYPESIDIEELTSLTQTINQQEILIEKLEKKIKDLEKGEKVAKTSKGVKETKTTKEVKPAAKKSIKK